jgi:hypothetical protein
VGSSILGSGGIERARLVIYCYWQAGSINAPAPLCGHLGLSADSVDSVGGTVKLLGPVGLAPFDATVVCGATGFCLAGDGIAKFMAGVGAVDGAEIKLQPRRGGGYGVSLVTTPAPQDHHHQQQQQQQQEQQQQQQQQPAKRRLDAPQAVEETATPPKAKRVRRAPIRLCDSPPAQRDAAGPTHGRLTDGGGVICFTSAVGAIRVPTGPATLSRLGLSAGSVGSRVKLFVGGAERFEATVCTAGGAAVTLSGAGIAEFVRDVGAAYGAAVELRPRADGGIDVSLAAE